MTNKPKVFSGAASNRFWAAVWGYWDRLEGKKPLKEQTRFEILCEYGVKAQELEDELYKLKGEADNEQGNTS